MPCMPDEDELDELLDDEESEQDSYKKWVEICRRRAHFDDRDFDEVN